MHETPVMRACALQVLGLRKFTTELNKLWDSVDDGVLLNIDEIVLHVD